MKPHIILVMLLTALLPSTSGALAAQPVYKFNGAPVTLAGTLIYEKACKAAIDPGTICDSRDVTKVPVLKLDTPLSVLADPSDGYNNHSFKNVETVQIVSGHNLPKRKTHITVTGKLFTQQLSWHITDVLIDAEPSPP